MELLHAYPNARLARANGVVHTAQGAIIPGTRIVFYIGNNTWALIADATNGLSLTTNRETMQMDIADAVDPARTESYWITTGWKWTSRSTTSVPWNTVALGSVPLATPDQIFALAGGVAGSQVAYTEVAYNPITKEIRVYVNGNRLPGTFTFNDSSLRVQFAVIAQTGAVPVYVGEIYVARFEGNEEPRLRRWKLQSLAPATNGIGANIDKVDGQMASVQATELVATYVIPAGSLALCVDTSAESVNNASDLTSRVTDGTTTATKRQSSFSGPLGTIVGGSPTDFRGHGMISGGLKPATNAQTLTVGLKAVDRT